MNILTLSGAPLCLLILLFLPTIAMAIDPPEREPSQFTLKTNYLQSPDEGIYKLASDNTSRKVFVTVTNRVNREANKGYLYSFNSDSLKVENKHTMSYRVFSLAINQGKCQFYIGHTQSVPLRISMFGAPTGKSARTSDRLSLKAANAADPRLECSRHMVYDRDSNTLFMSYSNMPKTTEDMKPLYKLLMLGGTTLTLGGGVKDIYKGTVYGLTMDEKTQKIYVGGRDYVNEIDAKNWTLLRAILLKDPRPQITGTQDLAVDSASDRAFVVVSDHDDRSDAKDGLYIFDSHGGKRPGYIHTGVRVSTAKYSLKYNELYVTNFISGTISAVDTTGYSITCRFNMPIYPNQMVLSDDMDTLYTGIKEDFSRDWDPDVFVEGVKECVLSIDLKKS